MAKSETSLVRWDLNLTRGCLIFYDLAPFTVFESFSHPFIPCFCYFLRKKNYLPLTKFQKMWNVGQISICYLDVNRSIPKISACRAKIWSLLASEQSEVNESQTSYSVEQADIFQYQSYSHSDDMFIILRSIINTDTSIGFDICIFVGKITWFKIFKIRFSKT